MVSIHKRWALDILPHLHGRLYYVQFTKKVPAGNNWSYDLNLKKQARKSSVQEVSAGYTLTMKK